MTDLRKRMQAAMARPIPKRFYKQATAEPAQTAGLWRIALDGRSAKTPGRHGLELPTEALADAVAAEWQAQGEHIDPAAMRLTTLAFTAIDGIAGKEQPVRDDIAAYAGNDLLCYRATSPARLAAQQADAWDPVLAWAARDFDATFVTTTSVVHVAQSPTTRSAIAAALTPLTAFELAGVHVMTSLTGSALLALAVHRGHMSAEDAWAKAHVDEQWQIAQWGEDDEAAARTALRWRDMSAAATLLTCLTHSRLTHCR
jgi:chaperone required for assembly of F1-ATPase